MDDRISQALSSDGIHKALQASLERQFSLNPRYQMEPEVDMILRAVAEVVGQNNALLMGTFRGMLAKMQTARAVPTEAEKAVNEAVNRVPQWPLPPQPPQE